MDKTVTKTEIPSFLRTKPQLRKFLIENGIHIDKIDKIIEREHFRISKGVGAVTSKIKSGEITYFVTGDVFKAEISSDAKLECLRTKSIDVYE